ncbi:hypothetical protein D3Y57_03160 (plasmid) [Sphingomonas paeninsulae]|uniref:Uncharacterized protein n=1 Tax=Sphingomonas paeninsulae TaxID=2319844 RepID=A0A494TGT1_SPHPE|nr:hypothetical protein D3Y57_03160 [Sphingomonas paeninsulae]
MTPKVWWWAEYLRESKRCGAVFNVDAPGPAGDGVNFDEDYRRIILSRSRARPRKPIDCIDAWAKRRNIPVRYDQH